MEAREPHSVSLKGKPSALLETVLIDQISLAVSHHGVLQWQYLSKAIVVEDYRDLLCLNVLLFRFHQNSPGCLSIPMGHSIFDPTRLMSILFSVLWYLEFSINVNPTILTNIAAHLATSFWLCIRWRDLLMHAVCKQRTSTRLRTSSSVHQGRCRNASAIWYHDP